ncbi:Rv3235 family protein [Asanoa sp. NPDC049573]|uniref:Rv3235 family protein n=1 Tax=Asanoa sp. NPDC049573 TaxID=3155396 RepID=UPI0034135A1B
MPTTEATVQTARPEPHPAPRGSVSRRATPGPAPYRVAHDGGASLVRRSPHQKRTVTRGYFPPIPVRPAPTFEPPYVDEPGADEWYREAAGQLAFDFATLMRQRDPGPPVRVTPPPTPPAPLEPQLSASPEARTAARRFTRACLEILNGYRPAAHVRSLSQPSTAHTLIDQLVDALRRMPGPPATPRRQHQPELVKLRRLRVSEPAPGVVEAAAALGTDSRTWAMAFRLEFKTTTWLGTVLQVI